MVGSAWRYGPQYVPVVVTIAISVPLPPVAVMVAVFFPLAIPVHRVLLERVPLSPAVRRVAVKLAAAVSVSVAVVLVPRRRVALSVIAVAVAVSISRATLPAVLLPRPVVAVSVAVSVVVPVTVAIAVVGGRPAPIPAVVSVALLALTVSHPGLLLLIGVAAVIFEVSAVTLAVDRSVTIACLPGAVSVLTATSAVAVMFSIVVGLPCRAPISVVIAVPASSPLLAARLHVVLKLARVLVAPVRFHAPCQTTCIANATSRFVITRDASLKLYK
eukprot:scaffold192903_cov43-Prasinocladus_malaysianus.AAC.2